MYSVWLYYDGLLYDGDRSEQSADAVQMFTYLHPRSFQTTISLMISPTSSQRLTFSGFGCSPENEQRKSQYMTPKNYRQPNLT